jgi:hypothetical protein
MGKFLIAYRKPRMVAYRRPFWVTDQPHLADQSPPHQHGKPMSRLDPLPSVVNGRFEATKIANFPKNEHWRRRAIEDSIPCQTYLAAE